MGDEAMVLEGAHVRLEPLQLAHVAALLAVATIDRATYRWTTVPATEGEMTAYVAESLRLRAAGSAIPFVTLARESGDVIGTTRFANMERWPWPAGSANVRAWDAVEVGWTWLAPAAQRTAVNTEAKLLMLAHAFETWGVHRLTLHTDSRNERSRRAIERIGGRLDGVLRANRASSIGDVRDTAVYSITAAEWPGVRAALEGRLRG
ncbi:MAG: GNAT family N-acetyltransferase [Tepidiformaceae bacterium]